jgi:hypothetical protein
MMACKLSQGTGGCTFNAVAGATTLSVEGTTGTVLFQRANYNGVDITGLPAKTLSFTIVAGATDLSVAYSFSDTANGAGVLKEEGCPPPGLMLVSAKEPTPIYHICA